MMNESASKYRIAHIGINNPDAESALNAVKRLCDVFDLCPNDETSTHIFAGDLFEVKKNCAKGKYGHVAIRTDDIEAAILHLAKKGVGIRENSIKRNADGKIKFVYLDLEICGFAFHLML